MRASEKQNFVYLNRAGDWPGFSTSGLERSPDGTLQLYSLGQLIDPLPAVLQTSLTPSGPGGVALDSGGNLYWTDPDQNRIFSLSACDGSVFWVPCVGGEGTAPGKFQTPRGLAIPSNRDALFVADSGNHRIQVIDPQSGELLEILPKAAATSASLSAPWSCALDDKDNLYVLDNGNRSVLRFFPTGGPDADFNQNASSITLQNPISLAVSASEGHTRICIADSAAHCIFFLDENGNPEKDDQGARIKIPLAPESVPVALAVTANTLFVADNFTKRIQEYRWENSWLLIGEVIGYQGPVSALLISGQTLYVSPGAGITPLRVSVSAGFVPLGAAWSSVIDLGIPVAWHELIAQFPPLPEGGHLDLFAYASSDKDDRPPVQFNSSERTFFSDPRWNRAVRNNTYDVTALYIGSNDPASPKLRYLWVGAELRSDSLVTPALQNLRVEFNQNGYLPLLPAIYAADSPSREFLPRLLALFQSFFEQVESEILDLPLLFDPKFAPRSFLSWLASWLDVDLEEAWPESKQRQVIAEAFKWFARRGTRKGLEHSILLKTGVTARVEEPILQAAWWCLPASSEACCEECAAEAADRSLTEDSVLGWTTVLAPSEPDGAIVGTTAVLDQSQLILDSEFGAPLFSGLAYQFSVSVPRSAFSCPSADGRIRAAIEAEMPAHAAYHLCIIDPLMRVGFQSRVGVDSVVAGPPPSMRLGDGSTLGTAAVLGGPAPALIGQNSEVGISSRLA